VGEVEPERGRDVLEVGVALVADRQELEDAAAVVVQQHDRQREPVTPRREQPPTS
jgi:hypothetical protein